MIKTRAGRARAKPEAATLLAVNDALARTSPAEFCELLYEEAKRQGVEAVATRAGMARRQLRSTLNGNKNPTLLSLFSILTALGIVLRAR